MLLDLWWSNDLLLGQLVAAKSRRKIAIACNLLLRLLVLH